MRASRLAALVAQRRDERLAGAQHERRGNAAPRVSSRTEPDFRALRRAAGEAERRQQRELGLRRDDRVACRRCPTIRRRCRPPRQRVDRAAVGGRAAWSPATGLSARMRQERAPSRRRSASAIGRSGASGLGCRPAVARPCRRGRRQPRSTSSQPRFIATADAINAVAVRRGEDGNEHAPVGVVPASRASSAPPRRAIRRREASRRRTAPRSARRGATARMGRGGSRQTADEGDQRASAAPQSSRWSRCPGHRRCCCRPAEAELRSHRQHRRSARAAAASADCAGRAPARRGSAGSSLGPSTPWFQERVVVGSVAVVLAVGLVVLAL